MKIKVKVFNQNCIFESSPKGEWIDLRVSGNYTFKTPFANTLCKSRQARNVEFDYQLIPLGIGMKLPKGVEANIVPRSSTFKNFSVLQTNSFAVIDHSYSGPNDEWRLPVLALKDVTLNEGDRVCQFRLNLSQKANLFQKIRWFLTSKIVFEFVEDYEGNDRGGIGSTGKN